MTSQDHDKQAGKHIQAKSYQKQLNLPEKPASKSNSPEKLALHRVLVSSQMAAMIRHMITYRETQREMLLLC